MMKNTSLPKEMVFRAAIILFAIATPAAAQILFPANKATMVNPDVQLKLAFKETPHVGTSGKIRIYDAADDRVVDTLDMSIPAGPTKPVDPAVRAKNYLT